MFPEIWTLEEAADFLKVKPEVVKNLVEVDEIPHFRVGPEIRFRPDLIIAWTEGKTGQGSDAEHIPQVYVSGRNECLLSKDGKTLFVLLHQSHTSITYSLIPVRGKARLFFPGYKVEFTVETDLGNVITRVTSASKGTKTGEPDKGNYVQGGLTDWFRKHGSEIRGGYCLRIRQLEKGKRYRLDLVPPEEACE